MHSFANEEILQAADFIEITLISPKTAVDFVDPTKIPCATAGKPHSQGSADMD